MTRRNIQLVLVLLACAAVLSIVAWRILESSLHPTPAVSNTEAQTSIMLDGQTIRVDIAATDAERQLGLGGRTGLAPDQGMLFVFAQDGHYEFWMKDMRFPIDILWISSAGQIVYIVSDLSPNSYPQAFGPSGLARYVLELPAGYATAHGVQIGDTVQLPL